jgi:restriction system protein
MACPRFEHFLLPVLQLLEDDRTAHWRDLIQPAADKLGLSASDREELTASGKQPRIVDRVYWAKTYLQRAGLLASVARGQLVITPEGHRVLDQQLTSINLDFLRQYPSMAGFLGRGKSVGEKHSQADAGDSDTPLEQIEAGYNLIRGQVAAELLSVVRRMHPAEFEKLVVELMVRLGYGGSFADAARAVGGSGDEGIDGIIKEDKLGFDVIYLQAKRYAEDNLVNDAEIRNFIGSLVTKHARKGVFVTTSSFRPKARDFALRGDHKIVLIDGQELAQLMIDHGIGVSVVSTYAVHKVDPDYFEGLT